MKKPRGGRKALKEAIRRAGSGAALGRLLGVKRQAINQAVKRGFAPQEWCAAIEAAYGVTRQELRPDVWEWGRDIIQPRPPKSSTSTRRT